MHKIKKEENDKEGIKTFSVGFEKGEYANELPYAKKVSELLGTKHKEIIIKPSIIKLLPDIIWHLDEPMADPALMPVYLLSKHAKKDVSVILTGDGGDEVFAGYDQYKFLRLGNKLKYVPFADKISYIMKILPFGILNRIYKYSSKMGRDSFKKVDLMISSFKKNSPSKAYYELMSLINDSERKGLLKEENFNNFDYKSLNQRYFTTKQDYLNQLLYFDIKNLLSESFLMKTDRMTMAHAVEARVPFLDHKLVQFAYNIPSRLKLNKGISKYILKKSLSGLLPKDIIYRKKQTFHVPIDNWIKKDLKEHVNLLLNEKEINKMGLFNYGQINKIFKNYNKGELFYARQIWNLICFKIWYNKFII
jgi:asparagine synthase (glutamine-hydrolysing)